ncbi:hypothetical protein SAMN04487831_11445 [Pseudobutyrivibrio sp. UC1225]|uniref:hypothetical protein n=1 Tax=Pseudobutyrivibrio sp. UC1225 TaxID=1798185 RepID=UPI0008E47B00|nr:hypothetical protein [Pseudobutyrivibrio sp. UC1225]SFO25322.1 hypothetical protein SAMN04487831_11445 [Pseudobutyrivibrio sp. UC1225]
MDTNILNSVSSNVSTTYTKPVEAKDSTKDTQETAKTEEKAGKFSEEAAVYEKSDEEAVAKTDKYSKGDRTALVQQLKADQEKMMNNLLQIVQKTIAGQGSTFAIASQDDMWKFLAEGKFTADPDTIAKAKEDISEDGYWGVEKTSDRILEFAKALSGDDPEKADELLAAFKKGYEQATGTWGKDLPEISSKTYDAVLKKFEAWKNGGKTENNTEAAESSAKAEG